MVVTGAAGAVGSHVGQIAKIKGCTVIGIAGSDEKGKWLVDDLGFDHFINYKDDKFKEKLEQATPKGVDCYFDNVGGEISSIVISRMNLYGRVSVCGSISGYNDTEPAKGELVFLEKWVLWVLGCSHYDSAVFGRQTAEDGRVHREEVD